jgi:hypothetical protein
MSGLPLPKRVNPPLLPPRVSRRFETVRLHLRRRRQRTRMLRETNLSRQLVPRTLHPLDPQLPDIDLLQKILEDPS